MYHVKLVTYLYFLIKCVESTVPNHLGPIGSDKNIKNDHDGPRHIELDISWEDMPDEVELTKIRPYDIDINLYMLKHGYRLKRVRENRSELWINSKDLDCRKVSLAYEEGEPLFLCVNCQSTTGPDRHFFLMKSEGSWTAVQNKHFYSIFNNYVLEKTTQRTLDLDIAGTLDKSDFYVNDNDDFPFLVIVPNVAVHVERVFDGSHLIWASNYKSKRCLYLSVYRNSDNPLMCLLTNSSESKRLFFRFSDNKWNEIRESEYECHLKGQGIDLSNFDNSVVLDLSSPEKELFLIHSFSPDLLYLRNFVPRPGLKLVLIVDGNEEIWVPENKREYCLYVAVNFLEDRPTLMMLYIKDSSGNHKIVYLLRYREKSWAKVDEFEYFYYLRTKRLPSELEKLSRTEPESYSSSFRNKQGLKIKTYLFKSNRPRGAIILVHGHREHFMSNFANFNGDWNFKNFGYPSFPNLNSLEDFELGDNNQHSGNTVKYSDIFTNHMEFREDPHDPSRYFYDCSMIQVLNEIGLDVYGLDLQSYGLSESFSNSRCFVNDFNDHVNDVLQFVDIVKRGRFMDEDAEWNGNVYSVGTDTFKDKLYIMGYSMGANIVFQAIQQFNKYTNGGADFVNGAISLSGMMKIDQKFTNPFIRVVSLLSLGFMSLIAPKTESRFERSFNWTLKSNDYIRLFDGFYYPKATVYKTLYQFFNATQDVRNQMNLYPRNLPTLFVHCKNDPVCSVQGTKEVYDNYIKGGPNCRFAELKGNSHDTPSSLFIYNVAPVLKVWLEKLIETPTTRKGLADLDYDRRRLRGSSFSWDSSTFEVVLVGILFLLLFVGVLYGFLNVFSRWQNRRNRNMRTRAIQEIISDV